MKVYALLSNYFDGCQNLVSVEQLYLNELDAAAAQIELEDKNEDSGQSWNIHEMEVK